MLAFIFLVFSILAFGLLAVYDASPIHSFNVYGEEYRFFYDQLVWAFLGILGFFFFYFFDYRRLKNMAFWIFLTSIFLLGFTLLPSSFSPEIYGSRRWIYLNPQGVLPALPVVGRVSFQPAEFAKLSTILYLAGFFAVSERERRRFSIFRFLIPVGVVSVILIAQPDFGTLMVLVAASFITYFAAGAPLWHFALTLPLGALALLVLAASAPYRLERITTFLNPSSASPLGVGYHIKQIFIALGSGGLFGLGIGSSRQKFEFLPQVTTDSIFAIIGEEFGFLGTALLVSAFSFLILKSLSFVLRFKDRFAQALGAGIVSLFGIQVLVNLSALTGLIPLTGVPLPLISYGGTSLIVTLCSFGILCNMIRKN